MRVCWECKAWAAAVWQHLNVQPCFAAFKKHIGIYPPLQNDRVLMNELPPYRGEKGNLKFPLNEPLPYELIERVVVALAQQYKEK